MPRWYALCNGADLPACQLCRRFVEHNRRDAEHPQQGFIQPTITGTHCNSFIERPHVSAITPTDRT